MCLRLAQTVDFLAPELIGVLMRAGDHHAGY